MKRFKIIATSIIILYALPNCTIYQSTSIPIEQAVNKGRVKIITEGENEHVYVDLIKVNNNYSGVWLEDKTQIDTAAISAIYLKDIRASKKKSRRAIILTILGTALGIALYSFLSFGG